MERERKSPTKATSHSSGTKEGIIYSKPLRHNHQQEEGLEDSKDLKLDEELHVVEATNDETRKAKGEKTRRKRRTKSKSPQKNLRTVENSGSNDSTEAVSKLHQPDINKASAKECVTLSEGDMVAIRVPEKLYIKGQPCLGKITTLADQQGLITVHYYTGTYEGRWRPMLSRTSPYLRKVATADVLCKFTLGSDGRMSPFTQRKLRTIVDDGRNESGDTS